MARRKRSPKPPAPRNSPARRGRPTSPRAGYRAVAETLRSQLAAGTWPKGAALPSVRELAQAHGVGRQVVWDALDVLKREGRVAPDGHRRLIATGTGSSHTLTHGRIVEVVGTTLDEVAGPGQFAMELQRGILLGAGELRRPLAIVHGGELGHHVPDDVLDGPLFGIVVLLNLQDQALRAYEKLGVPVVLADRPQARWKLHAASVANEAAAFDATNRLLALGHRRIAFLRYASALRRAMDPDGIERQAGYERALRAAGISADMGNFFTLTSAIQPGSASIQALLRARPAFTAAFAADGRLAEALLSAARSAGRSVPRDLSVVCFESQGRTDFPVSGPRTDFVELGRRAVHLLSKPRTPPREERLATAWFEGKSIGPALG
ncbi:MAG: substrate-binding domain-containing protein [Planctomycetes bacterium]|nr:substrate-binding domain-containing protein [Planctomycetota bacterium]